MSSSDDEVPLALRAAKQQSAAPPAAAPSGAANGAPSQPQSKPVPKRKLVQDSESGSESESSSSSGDEDEDASSSSSSGDDVPLAQRQQASAAKKQQQRKKQQQPAAKRQRTSTPPAKKPARGGGDGKRRSSSRAGTGSPGVSKGGKQGKGEVMWNTLRHAGVAFPPEYQPHGVKMRYDGRLVELTQDQEEVATMFAVMKDTAYMNKPQFLKNFWDGFKEVLGPGHVIKGLEKCDFTPMYDWFQAEREKKKNASKEEKEAAKKQKEAQDAKYKTAYVNGLPEPVGNFRVEPPGLFRGRGEHPKMGMVKRRIYPRDITINIGEGEPVPEHPYPGQTWKEVRHDHTVTWLAYWRDSISNKDFKYVFLGATSSFKAESDMAKYEKARKLKGIVGEVRKNYEKDMVSTDMRRRQMGTALYFIDKLALRAGHEKDEDEAETVGCCTLKCENVEMVPPRTLKFDFLGKDSIRYENSHEVHPTVYANIEKFKRVDVHGKKKQPSDQVFDSFDANDLNKVLRNIMDGLSVKVFRTYNASITLERLLKEQEAKAQGQTVDELKADYDHANKEVAIMCNHQRSVPAAHGGQLEKLTAKLSAVEAEVAELETELKAALKGKGSSKPDVVEKKLERKREQLARARLQMHVKEDLKTVSLGTSKINYMDPRITVAWCKRNEAPIEKLFNKALLGKFSWAMEEHPNFVF